MRSGPLSTVRPSASAPTPLSIWPARSRLASPSSTTACPSPRTTSVGGEANVAACNAVTPSQLQGACDILGPATAVTVLCLDLGFSEQNCEDVVAGATAAGALANCATLVASQGPICAGTAVLSGTDDCTEWGGHGYLPGSIDMGVFNAAVATISDLEMGMLSGACSTVAATLQNSCTNHQLGHICAQVAQADTCTARTDIAVALEYCNTAGTPQLSVLGICQAATAQTQAIADLCAVVGVQQTGVILCDGVGYGADTCAAVGAQALAAFGEDCAVAAAGASNLCPQLLALVTETTCPEWATVDGLTIALGYQAIGGLAIAVPAGVTAVDYYLSVSPNNLGAKANVAACNAVPQATV